MDKKKLARLRRDYARLCAKIGSIRERDLVGLAQKLGRRPCNRGKHPTYISDDFRDLRPISIPSHAGGFLKRGTILSILDDLHEDISRWQEYLDANESETDESEESDE